MLVVGSYCFCQVAIRSMGEGVVVGGMFGWWGLMWGWGVLYGLFLWVLGQVVGMGHTGICHGVWVLCVCCLLFVVLGYGCFVIGCCFGGVVVFGGLDVVLLGVGYFVLC